MLTAVRRRSSVLVRVALLATLVVPVAAQSLPDRIPDAEFWKLIEDFSEPNGFFRSDNLLSNEIGYQIPIPTLVSKTRQGGVYLGVGPEQNFTYIAALHPKIVFITDIRRGNMLLHMMYKALFELYPNRADFISHLFSRPRPPGLDTNTTPDVLFNAFIPTKADSGTFDKTLAAITRHLRVTHGFRLSDEDIAGVTYVLDRFFWAGPYLDYNFSSGGGGGGGGGGFSGGRTPTYSELMLANDGTGMRRSYLASEANFRVLRDLHMKNLFVPLVGDFGGAKALRAVGKYLKDHGVTVTAMYCSNVEQYLFQDGKATAFYANVATFPIDSASSFIRSAGGRGGIGGFGFGTRNLLAPIAVLMDGIKAGKMYSYDDVLNMSN